MEFEYTVKAADQAVFLCVRVCLGWRSGSYRRNTNGLECSFIIKKKKHWKTTLCNGTRSDGEGNHNYVSIIWLTSVTAVPHKIFIIKYCLLGFIGSF